MKKSEILISGSHDGKVKIWKFDNQNQLIKIQTLDKNSINRIIKCLIINKNEDQIFIGTQILNFNKSVEGSIEIWKFSDQQWNYYQTINCSNQVYSISLNPEENKLISSQDNNLIQVFELTENKWNHLQHINVQISGYRLCFINDKEFVFQPKNGNILQFYYSQNNQFNKSQKIKIHQDEDKHDLFPIRFIKDQNRLIIKHSKNVNVYKKYKDGKFILDQFIIFRTDGIYGNVSEDGQYLITWDHCSEKYQIRKWQQII